MSASLRSGLQAIARDLKRSLPAESATTTTGPLREADEFVDFCDICENEVEVNEGEDIPGTQLFICDECITSPDEDIQDAVLAMYALADASEDEKAGASSTALRAVLS